MKISFSKISKKNRKKKSEKNIEKKIMEIPRSRQKKNFKKLKKKTEPHIYNITNNDVYLNTSHYSRGSIGMTGPTGPSSNSFYLPIIAGVDGSNNTMLYSYDGFNWKTASSPFDSLSVSTPRVISSSYNKIVAAGLGQDSSSNPSIQVIRSTDGINWETCATALFSERAWAIATNNSGTWVIGGSYIEGSLPVTMYYSTDDTQTFKKSVSSGYSTGLSGEILGSVNCVIWVEKSTGPGMFIAGGYESVTCPFQISISYDGINWYYQPNNSMIINYLCFNGDVIIAGGQGSNISITNIRWSNNGTDWMNCSGIMPNFIISIVWNGDMFVAVGRGINNICYSYDGKYWYASQTIWIGPITIYTITYDGEKFIVGTDDPSGNILGYSYNGINWKPITNLNVGNIFRTLHVPKISTLPYLRENVQLFNNYLPMIYVNTNLSTDLYQLRSNTISYSYDGFNWKKTSSPFDVLSNKLPLGISSSYNKIVIAGLSNDSSSNPSTQVIRSSDGINWEVCGTALFSDMARCVANNNRGTWVVGGRYRLGSPPVTMYYSNNDTKTFRISTSAAYPTGLSGEILGEVNSVIWAEFYDINIQSIFIAAGSISSTCTNSVSTSSNGVSWAGLGNVFGGTTKCYTLCFNGTTVVAGCSDGKIFWSNDGITWTLSTGTVPNINIRNIAWNGNIFVAVGDGSNNTNICYSNNGKIWNASSTIWDSSKNLLSIAYDGEKFLVGTNDISGTNLGYSYNGINWKSLIQPIGTAINGIHVPKSAILYNQTKNSSGAIGATGPIGGSNTQVIYNNNGTASGSPYMVFNDAVGTMTLRDLSLNNPITMNTITVPSSVNQIGYTYTMNYTMSTVINDISNSTIVSSPYSTFLPELPIGVYQINVNCNITGTFFSLIGINCYSGYVYSSNQPLTSTSWNYFNNPSGVNFVILNTSNGQIRSDSSYGVINCSCSSIFVNTMPNRYLCGWLAAEISGTSFTGFINLNIFNVSVTRIA